MPADDDYDEEEQEEEEDLFSLSLQELAASSHVLMLPPPPLYDVQEYNDDELYTLLEVDEDDPDLEGILLRKTQRYLAMGNGAGSQLAQFYLAVYQRLFDTQPVQQQQGNEEEEQEEEEEEEQPGNNGGTVLQQSIAYSKGTLNPLLKESITRVVSIDSAYREDVENTPSTSFTFNLSEPLKDVVALKLYSVQIPYAWYTINSSFGGNFFYIRGNVPGLNNGNHDIRVEIKSGNYTEVQLQDAINAEFVALSRLPQYADLSFGGTATSFDINTMKMTFNIDLKKVYDQSYYRLVFPNWVSPVDEDVPRQTTLASYLGFNNHDTTTGQSIYPCVSVRSPPTLPATPNATASSYLVNAANRTFQIVFSAFATTTTTAATTPVTYEVTLRDPTTGNPLDGNYSMAALLRALETGLAKATFLDQEGSSATLQPVEAGSELATLVLVLRLNRFKTPNGTTPGALAVTFPDESGSSNKVWTSSQSAFQFPLLQQSCTEIVAETNMLQTSYIVSEDNAVSIAFPCTMAPYNVAYNTYTATVQASAKGYLLDEIVDAVNVALRQAETATSIAGSKDLNGDQTKLYLDTFTNKLDLRFDITRVFPNSYYAFASQHSYCGTFDTTDLSGTHVFEFYFRLSASYVLGPDDAITIYPITPRLTPTLASRATGFVDDASAEPFVVRPTGTTVYANYNALEDAMNKLFRDYRDPRDTVESDNPLSRCTVSIVYDQIKKRVKSTLTVVVNKTLTQTHYHVEFRDTTAELVANNFWVKNLFFSPLYTPAQFITDSANSALSHLYNNQSIFDNSITVVEYENDRFSLVPYIDATSDLLQHSEYQHTVIVPPGTYSSNQLYAAINAQLDANPLLRGSAVGSRSVNGQSYTTLDFRIHQAFTTQDYRVVFYDTAGFTSCLQTATSKSLVTVTWDTTIGWLLGYRESPTYALSDYLAETPGKSALKYYLPENPNVCVLIGDTGVSVNLFNYFLIVLDDYTQNHLNDGLVTTQQAQTVIDVPLETKVTCDPVTGLRVVSAATDPGATPLTAKQLYAAQQKVLSSKLVQKTHSPGPFVKNVFGIIPMKLTGLKQGQTYTELGGTLQQQNRMYFGPVNIHRMSIQLLSDRGNLVDLNNTNWGFVLMAEQLYKKT